MADDVRKNDDVKDQTEGTLKDAGGRVQRQVGEWTGDKELQGEGLKNQAEGKIQNAWGNVKEGARDLKDDITGRDKDKEKDVA